MLFCSLVLTTCHRYDFNSALAFELRSMQTGRVSAAAFALANGDLVVAGGYGANGLGIITARRFYVHRDDSRSCCRRKWSPVEHRGPLLFHGVVDEGAGAAQSGVRAVRRQLK